MGRVYNFAAGPAMLPESVLLRAQQELLNWHDTGVSIMEIGHRTAAFQELLHGVEDKLRQVMSIPANYKVLFLPGGGQGHFSFIPMNLTGMNAEVDYLITGVWSERAAKYAQRYAKVNVALDAGVSATTMSLPSEWQLNHQAAYLYYCPNETINGLQFAAIPQSGQVPLVADFTSSILASPIDVSRFGLIFAAAQKNLGIAGITLLIIRDDLLDQAQAITPEVFNYQRQALQNSVLNTIPTVAVYMMDLMLDWIINEQGGLSQMTTINQRKATKLYRCIDDSNGFYHNLVDKCYRSQINIPFQLPNDELLKLFLLEAGQFGLKYLNGHKLVGGARASLYNAMPEAGVDQLIEFMQDFANKHLR